MGSDFSWSRPVCEASAPAAPTSGSGCGCTSCFLEGAPLLQVVAGLDAQRVRALRAVLEAELELHQVEPGVARVDDPGLAWTAGDGRRGVGRWQRHLVDPGGHPLRIGCRRRRLGPREGHHVAGGVAHAQVRQVRPARGPARRDVQAERVVRAGAGERERQRRCGVRRRRHADLGTGQRKHREGGERGDLHAGSPTVSGGAAGAASLRRGGIGAK